MQEKTRLDVELCRRGLAESREKGRKMILAGYVTVNGVIVLKPSFSAGTEDVIKSAYKEKYVGRGGYKIERALKFFNISLGGLTTLDVGASTGGFTDCMLQNGAVKVYAVDVGEGQLHHKLRHDIRVVNLEKTNFRDMDIALLGDGADFACVDVSFISLKLILPSLYRALKLNGCAVTLIKPQFETGGRHLGKNGVVRDKSAHMQVLRNFMQYTKECQFLVKGLTFSPITGAQGNIEYLAYITKEDISPAGIDIKKVVDEAFAAHKGRISSE